MYFVSQEKVQFCYYFKFFFIKETTIVFVKVMDKQISNFGYGNYRFNDAFVPTAM